VSRWQKTLVVLGVAVAVIAAAGVWWTRDRESRPANQVVDEAQSAFFSQAHDPKLAFEIVSGIHDEANHMVGYGATPNWDTFHAQQYPALTKKVDTLLAEFYSHSDSQNEEIKRIVHDIQNMKSLLQIADKIHDRQAIVYLHRIASDLAEFVFTKDGNPDEYWAATHALDAPEAKTIDEYISSHS
jgi:hypothetical protein